MTKPIPLFEGKVLLKKFKGKGGWTYAEIPSVPQNSSSPFGWVTVKGFVGKYEFKQYKLMPMGEGKLFLPVKSAIRKKINKEEGDYVDVVLFRDIIKVKIPDELNECFENEPSSVKLTFDSFTESEKKAYLDWIYNSKSEETKARRILLMMQKLKLNLKHHQKLDSATD